MENNEFKNVCIKNRTCYCLDGIIKLEDVDLDNILIGEESHENILIYNISYKILIDPKPLRIRFIEIDGFIRIYDETRYLTLFGPEKYDAIYKSQPKKWHHVYFFSLFCEDQSYSYDSLPTEKGLTVI